MQPGGHLIERLTDGLRRGRRRHIQQFVIGPLIEGRGDQTCKRDQLVDAGRMLGGRGCRPYVVERHRFHAVHRLVDLLMAHGAAQIDLGFLGRPGVEVPRPDA